MIYSGAPRLFFFSPKYYINSLTNEPVFILNNTNVYFLGWPVQGDGAETEHGGRAEELVEKLDGFADEYRLE